MSGAVAGAGYDAGGRICLSCCIVYPNNDCRSCFRWVRILKINPNYEVRRVYYGFGIR